MLSNIFMTFAWYGQLKHLGDRTWIIAALVSWGIALFEYLLQVPANRIGHGVMSLGQLKILAGSHHVVGVRAVCGVLHEGKTDARLPVGGTVSAGGGIFSVPHQAGTLTAPL